MDEKLVFVITERKTDASWGTYDFAHLTAHLATVADDGLPRSLSGYGESRGLRDIQVSCQMDVPRPGHEESINKGSYAYETASVGGYSVGLYEAEALVKFLRGIERRMTKQYEALGAVSTFADYLMRVAKAAGITDFYIVAGRNGWASARPANAPDAHYWVRTAEREYLNGERKS